MKADTFAHDGAGRGKRMEPSEDILLSSLELRPQLQDQLMGLSFHGFEHAIHELLTRMGYSDVQILSRHSWKGRTHHGGRDIDAFAQIGVTRTRVIVQAKQYRRPVQRRFVDELRGVMLRTEASQAILVTTSFFPGITKSTAQADPRIPVRLIDGSELLDLLIAHRIGARRRSGDGELVLDEDLFHHLNREYPRSPQNNRERLSAEQDELQSKRLENPPLNQGETMTWRTHTLAGISSLWLLATVPHGLDAGNIGLLATVAAFGALLPDLDAAESKVKSLGIGGVRPFVPVSVVVHRAWGHRGLLHAPAGLAGVGIICLVLTRWWGLHASAALFLGYMSHLAADSSTKTGIPLTPLKGRFYLLPRSLRFVTGSKAEEVLLPILAAAVLLLILSNLPVSILRGI